jgi:hypothetical protein
MSGQVYTRRLAAAKVLAGGNNEIYLAPAGTTVVRDVIIDATTEAGTNTYFLILRVPGFADFTIINGPDTTTEVLHLELRQVLNEGDSLRLANFGQTAELRVLVTGYVFS